MAEIRTQRLSVSALRRTLRGFYCGTHGARRMRRGRSYCTAPSSRREGCIRAYRSFGAPAAILLAPLANKESAALPRGFARGAPFSLGARDTRQIRRRTLDQAKSGGADPTRRLSFLYLIPNHDTGDTISPRRLRGGRPPFLRASIRTARIGALIIRII